MPLYGRKELLAANDAVSSALAQTRDNPTELPIDHVLGDVGIGHADALLVARQLAESVAERNPPMTVAAAMMWLDGLATGARLGLQIHGDETDE